MRPGPRPLLRLLMLAILLTAHLVERARPALAGDVKSKALSAKDGGEIYEAKSADGLTFWWRGPASYDEARGAGLTLILHGSNLTHEWGFANHDAKTFRPDDVVVSPDGTTANGKGGFNFLDGKKDADRLHALIEEVKKVWKVRGVYLYGHSQGSFFALHYAGLYPQDVQGIVAHASGLWRQSSIGKAGHGQAIVLMHGTQDPVVPYDQSVGGIAALTEAGYPLLRLRSLEGWNHWPAEHNGEVRHTSQQLAWVEGMTTTDPARLEACFQTLLPGDGKEQKAEHDWAGLWSLARRLSALEQCPAPLKERAAKAVTIVEALAEAHTQALSRVKVGAAFDKQDWVGHLPIFLRAFRGVPAAEALASTWKDALDKQQKEGLDGLRRYWQNREKKPAEAFEAGCAAVAAGFLTYLCQDREMLTQLKTWHGDAKKLKLSKAALKSYDAVAADLLKTFGDGWKAFADLNAKADRP